MGAYDQAAPILRELCALLEARGWRIERARGQRGLVFTPPFPSTTRPLATVFEAVQVQALHEVRDARAKRLLEDPS